MEEVKLGKLELLRKKTISFLRNYGRDSNDYKGWVVLCAPAYGAPSLLRVYMNGGNIGKIAISDKAITTGIRSSAYAHKHKGEIPDIVAILKKDSKCSEEQRLEALTDTNYLNYAKEATKKYSNKANHKDTERTTETLIMDYHNQESGNAAIDMELQYSIKHFGWTKTKRPGQNYKSEMVYRNKTWYNEACFDNSKDTKSPRIDLMVLNEEGIGFVELKVDNANCENLGNHIRHMNYILSHKDTFIQDAERRIGVLKKYGLLEKEMQNNLSNWEKNHNIWCGILFVGSFEHLSGAKVMIKEHLDKVKDNIKCAFVDHNVIKGGKLNLSKENFVSGDAFVEPKYIGVS